MLNGRDSHVLACRACGAPLRNLKMVPRDRATPRRAKGTVDHRMQAPLPPQKQMRAKKGRQRKSMFRRVMEEAFDVIEDIID